MGRILNQLRGVNGKRPTRLERRYRELVEAYAKYQSDVFAYRPLPWDQVQAEVKACGKTLDQFASDWRLALLELNRAN